MNDDYINRTLNAYNADPKKYEDATENVIAEQEITEFLSQIPTKDLPILDAGCAFGRDTAQFASHGYKVQGIDMSDELLKRAHELYPEISFTKMDVRTLDFPDENFAGIWSNATLLHLNDADVRKALAELYRVLVPGGTVFVSFKQGSGEEELVDKFSSNNARYYNYHTVESVQELVENSGLKVSKIYIINERERWGPAMRDLNWVYCFATKNERTT